MRETWEVRWISKAANTHRQTSPSPATRRALSVLLVLIEAPATPARAVRLAVVVVIAHLIAFGTGAVAEAVLVCVMLRSIVCTVHHLARGYQQHLQRVRQRDEPVFLLVVRGLVALHRVDRRHLQWQRHEVDVVISSQLSRGCVPRLATTIPNVPNQNNQQGQTK